MQAGFFRGDRLHRRAPYASMQKRHNSVKEAIFCPWEDSMSDVLRQHIKDFGFTHSEIARRAVRLNQATAYRIVEGETTNPSLKSVTGIVEATALTDADAGVLYRRVVGNKAVPKRHAPPKGVENHQDAALYTKNALDSGQIRDAAYGVMAMFDMANDDAEIADAYEQAGIVYMGLGRWEEAQANLEAADSLIPGNIHDPTLSHDILNRKLTLMTNIGSLMAKRGNASWAMMFGQNVVTHPNTSLVNRGWGHLVMGEAALALEAFADAQTHFQDALSCFGDLLVEAEGLPEGDPCGDKEQSRAYGARLRAISQAEGNQRWARIHLVFSRARCGSHDDVERLADLEAEWTALDPEASAMAGLLNATCMQNEKRRDLKLRDIQARAKRHGLGEIAQRAKLLLGAALFLLAMATGARSTVANHDSASTAQAVVLQQLARGNTGKGGIKGIG